MSPATIFITTPLGNVGLETLRALATRPERAQLRLVAGVRQPDRDRAALTDLVDEIVPFDFADSATPRNAYRTDERELAKKRGIGRAFL